jgi:hypothetical protein
MLVSEATSNIHFTEEPVFQEVVEAIGSLDQDKNLLWRRRAKHRASEYIIEDGKLWQL